MPLEENIVEEVEGSESSLISQQAARTELRESFLMAVNKLSGKPCKILTYEKTKLDANFVTMSPESQDVLVQDLKTPANISIKSALLRSTDVLSIQFDLQGPVKQFTST